MNILYVFGGEKAQGAEIVIERLMTSMASYHQLHLILSPGEFAGRLIAENKPYRITTLPGLKKLNRETSGPSKYIFRAVKNYLTIPFFIYKYIKANNIQIVHANIAMPASYLLPSLYYSKLFNKNIKWVWSDHDLKNLSKIDKLISGACVQAYDKTLLVSGALKYKYPHQADKVRVLYNGLDTNKYYPSEHQRSSFRTKLQFDDNNIVIGIAGVIHPDKGPLELIKAFCRLSEYNTHIRLVIAGNFVANAADYGSEVRNWVQQNNQITYLGQVSDMAGFYNGCDILVNNSNNYRSEALGTTIYEAMACEKIVIAANTGGTPEIITDNVDGFLFAPESIPALEGALAFAIKNYPQLENVKKLARQKVLDKFNINAMVNNYSSILNEL
jgi:glycosyltransferase involved in cell wall biosynthesis